MRKLLITILLFCSSAAVRAQQPTAPDIFKRAAAVYSDCRTYSDEGTASYKIAGYTFGSSRQVHFHTAFASPDRFRFEAEMGGKSAPVVVWSDGGVVRTAGPTSFIYRTETLDGALLALGFPSLGASITVPQLLLSREVRSSDVLGLITNPKVAGEEKIDGQPAFRIEGTLWDQPIKIWIDRDRYVILKVYRKSRITDRGEETTVQYKPRLNSDIAPELLIAPPAPSPPVTAPVNASPVNVPTLAPPKLRGFGASLVRRAGEKPASGGRASDDDDVVRVDTDFVVSPVLVLGSDGRIIPGLTKDDFIVKEDDQLQQVASLSLGDSNDVPRSIVLIIDYSTSQLPYIRTSIESAKMLVDKLHSKDRMAIVTDDVNLLVNFTGNKELLKSQLESLKTSALAGHVGTSDQFDAMMATLTEIFSVEDVRPIVIFQTDGDQLEGLKGGSPPNPFWLPRRYSFEDVLTAAEKARVTIYPVISGMRYEGVAEAELSDRALVDWKNRENAMDEVMRARNMPVTKADQYVPSNAFLASYANQWRQRQVAMVQLAKLTGAWPEFLERPAQADEIYTRILSDIDRRYIIGYYPTNRARDGKRRQVRIEVRDHPEYVIWGQKSYFAREN